MQSGKKNILRDHPLLSKMIFYIFIFSTLATIMLSGGKMLLTFQQDAAKIHHHLESLKESQLEVLTSNVWALNEEVVTLQLNSILQHPDIIYVELIDTAGNQHIAGNKPVVLSETIVKQFELFQPHKGENHLLATLKVYATKHNILQRLLDEAPWVIGGQFVTIIFFCAFIVLLFHLLYNRHISQIISFTKTLDLNSLDHPLVLEREPNNEDHPDELDLVVNAINDLRKRFDNGLQQMQTAELSLQASEDKYRQIYNAPNEAILLRNVENGTLLDVNQAMLDMYGYSKDEALGLSLADLSAENESVLKEKVTQVLQMKVDAKQPLIRWKARRKNGEMFWVEVDEKIINMGGEKCFLSVVRDITERNRLEAELNQAQKLEAIGTLAGGIAHDFNNILSAIFGYTELAQMQVQDNPKLSDDLSGILQAAQRARDLVKQILTFSRKSNQEKQPLQISLIVKEALKLIRSSIPATVRINHNINSTATALADPTQIHQIVMNLCTNAYHAMEETGGLLSVSLNDIEIPRGEHLSGTELPPGRYLCLEVSDTGKGMDKQTQKNIFDPYFTTKGATGGTGLGLAVVHGIVESHNGKINVYSEPEQGTVFNIYLPSIAEKEITSAATPEKDKIRGGYERIMFVDDEEPLTMLAAEIFSSYGYTIDTFTDPVLALTSFVENPDAYSMLITDMAMPSLSGVELSQKIMVTKPDLPIILCSGFSKDINKEISMEISFRKYFQKPIVMSKLVRSVREILDQQENHV